MIYAPQLGLRYWVALCSASVLGANLGDFLSRELHLGYWRGLPVLALLIACVALAARIAPRSTAWYWIAVVLVRAAATNLSDWQILTPGEPPMVRSTLSFPIVIVSWSVALAYFASRDRGATNDEYRTWTGPWFWATILIAGTLGTATGDWLAFRSGLELPGASILSTIALGAGFIALSNPARLRATSFWLFVALVRTWGTNVGDLMTDTIGLLQSTTLSTVLVALVMYAWRPRGQTQLV